MKYIVALLLSAGATWIALTVFVDEPRVVRESPRSREIVSGSHSDEVRAAAIPRGRGSIGIVSPTPVEPFDRLKQADPWTADNLRQAVERGVERIVRDAHAKHHDDPAACAPGLDVLPTVALVESETDRASISIAVRADARLGDATQRCIRDYFSARAVIGDDDIGGPFPITSVEVDYPLPARLSLFLDERTVGLEPSR